MFFQLPFSQSGFCGPSAWVPTREVLDTLTLLQTYYIQIILAVPQVFCMHTLVGSTLLEKETSNASSSHYSPLPLVAYTPTPHKRAPISSTSKAQNGVPIPATRRTWHPMVLAHHIGSLEFLKESDSCYWNQNVNWLYMAPNPASCERNDKTPQRANQIIVKKRKPTARKDAELKADA